MTRFRLNWTSSAGRGVAVGGGVASIAGVILSMWGIAGEEAGLGRWGVYVLCASVCLVSAGLTLTRNRWTAAAAIVPLLLGLLPATLGLLLGLLGPSDDSGSWGSSLYGWAMFAHGCSFLVLALLMIAESRLAIGAAAAAGLGLALTVAAGATEVGWATFEGGLVAVTGSGLCGLAALRNTKRFVLAVASLCVPFVLGGVAVFVARGSVALMGWTLLTLLVVIASTRRVKSLSAGLGAWLPAHRRSTTPPSTRGDGAAGAASVRRIAVGVLTIEVVMLLGYAAYSLDSGTLHLQRLWTYQPVAIGLIAQALAAALALGAFGVLARNDPAATVARAAGVGAAMLLTLLLSFDARFPLGEAVGVLGAALAAHAMVFAYPRRRVFLQAVEVLGVPLLGFVIFTEVPGLALAFALGGVALLLELRQFVHWYGVSPAAV